MYMLKLAHCIRIVVNMQCVLMYVCTYVAVHSFCVVVRTVDSCGGRHVQAPPLPPHHLHWQYMCVSGHLPISQYQPVCEMCGVRCA